MKKHNSDNLQCIIGIFIGIPLFFIGCAIGRNINVPIGIGMMVISLILVANNYRIYLK